MKYLTLIGAVLLSCQFASAAWLNEPHPLLSTQTGISYGDDFSAVDLSYPHALLDTRTLGDHAPEGPYRLWHDFGYVIARHPDNINHYGRVWTMGADDVFKVWIQRGSELPVLSAIMDSSALSTESCLLQIQTNYTNLNLTSLPDPASVPDFDTQTAAYKYGQDLSGIDLATPGSLISDKWLNDSGRVWFGPGCAGVIIPTPQDSSLPPEERFIGFQPTYFYSDQPDVISVWTQRGDETPILDTLARVNDFAGEWYGLRVIVWAHSEMAVVNPGGASFDRGAGDLAYDSTGFGAGGAGIFSETVVSVENLALDAGFATLKLWYSQAAVDELLIDESTIRMYWYDPIAEDWLVAGDATNDVKNIAAVFVLGEPTENLGDWGLDMTGNYVWANIDHASVYGMSGVPEPTTAILLLLGMGIMGAARRRTRKIKARQG